jgi:hypothetical protein
MHQLVFQLQVGGEVRKTACRGVSFFFRRGTAAIRALRISLTRGSREIICMALEVKYSAGVRCA